MRSIKALEKQFAKHLVSVHAARKKGVFLQLDLF